MCKNKTRKVKSKYDVQLSDVEKQISRAVCGKNYGEHGNPSGYSWADWLKLNSVLTTWVIAHGLTIPDIQKEPRIFLPFWRLLAGFGIEITEEDKIDIVDDFFKD